METPSCRSSSTRAQSRLLPGQARVLVRPLSSCLRQTDGVSPPPKWARMWTFNDRDVVERVPLSHVLHRRHKTISASSLDPRLAPLCTAPTHEHSYYVNWALDRGISATTPAIIRGVEPMPDRRCPGNPRQGPGGLQGSLLCFHIICKDGEAKISAKQGQQAPRSFWLFSGCLAVWLLPPPLHPSGSWPTLDAVQIYGYLSCPSLSI